MFHRKLPDQFNGVRLRQELAECGVSVAWDGLRLDGNMLIIDAPGEARDIVDEVLAKHLGQDSDPEPTLLERVERLEALVQQLMARERPIG